VSKEQHRAGGAPGGAGAARQSSRAECGVASREVDGAAYHPSRSRLEPAPTPSDGRAS